MAELATTEAEPGEPTAEIDAPAEELPEPVPAETPASNDEG